MKCTITSIRNIELSGDRVGSRVEGFIPMENITIIPDCICKWMSNYEGIKVVPYTDGLFVAAWGETVCNERDTYDANVGAHIAESKAKAKIYRFIRNYAEMMSNYFESLGNIYQDIYLKYDHCVDHEEAHLATLGNKND